MSFVSDAGNHGTVAWLSYRTVPVSTSTTRAGLAWAVERGTKPANAKETAQRQPLPKPTIREVPLPTCAAPRGLDSAISILRLRRSKVAEPKHIALPIVAKRRFHGMVRLLRGA